MRKFYLLALTSLVLESCNNESEMFSETNFAAPAERGCASYEVLQNQLIQDPALAERMEKIEAITRRIQSDERAYRKLADGTYVIPVQVNVLYGNNAENVSDAKIASQIAVLNEDFGATNSDYSSTPSIFQSVRSGDTSIKFELAGVTRKATTKASWKTNDDMKRSSRGGIDPTTPSTTLNIWVCDLGRSLLGYAQFPGGSLSTDGVVIHYQAFGRNFSDNYSNFNRGRTATHEIGHYFNLRHIWGDQTCGSDQVNDTPVHNTSNGGCPTYPHRSTCTGQPVEMTMNYMDYTYDQCMYIFSGGQKTRMLATFASGGGRTSLAQP